MSKLSKVGLLSLIVVAAAACSKEDVKGACIVDFDDLGGKGTACTVDSESKCKAADLPPVRPGGMGTLKMKSFVAGKTCKDEGFAAAGCSDIALAWSFQQGCP